MEKRRLPKAPCCPGERWQQPLRGGVQEAVGKTDGVAEGGGVLKALSSSWGSCYEAYDDISESQPPYLAQGDAKMCRNVINFILCSNSLLWHQILRRKNDWRFLLLKARRRASELHTAPHTKTRKLNKSRATVQVPLRKTFGPVCSSTENQLGEFLPQNSAVL